MATLNQNGIIFTLNADAVTPFDGKYTNVQNFDESTGLYKINQTKLNNIGVDKSFNAVEIDWNGAQLSLPEELNLGTTIKLLLAECIWSLETILNEKVHLTSGVHFCC